MKSTVGSGSEFRVYLPCDSVAQAAEGGTDPNALPDGHGERILVVDGEESILALTRAALENYGYQVSTAASGLEALARFRDDPDAIGLVITDHVLPFMDGQTLIALLRKIQPDIKVILTSGSDKGTEEQLDKSGTQGFISKPFTTEQLLTTIHDVLTKR